MSISCITADLMKEYFNVKHKPNLDKKLKSKFGEYADINVNTIPNENGGDISLSFGIYDLSDELVNFSFNIAQRINNDKNYEYTDFTSQEIQSSLIQYINNNSLNIDIDWEENSKSINLFYNDDNFKNMEIKNDFDNYVFMILNELYNSVNLFLDETISASIKEFNEDWVYEYSIYE